jgi:probable HAF family extracellular repeat protein
MTCRPRTLMKAAWMLVALLAPIAVNAQTTVKYHVVKLLEIPAPTGCVPTSINDNGDVVGYCNAGGDSFGVVWHGASPSDLGKLVDGTFSHAWGINSAGQIVGDSNTGNNLDPKAVVFGPAGWMQLDNSGGSAQAAYGITDAGVIFGNFTTQRHPGTEGWDPVFWTFDAAHDRYNRSNLPKPIGTPVTGVSGAFIYAATKLGIAVGQVASDLVGNQGGLWKNDATHTLVVLDKPAGFASGVAFGVSDDGRAVGSISNVAGTHAALWQNDAANTPVDLGALSGDPDATAYGVNTSGQVVGVSVGPASPQGRIERAFVYQSGSLADLSSLVDPADGAWKITRAVGINNAGAIIGTGVLDGVMSPVLLTPTIVSCSTITITSPALNATVGDAFSVQLSAAGGTAPYSYAITSGALPAGLSLSSAGVMSGTPTAAGDVSIMVSASDGAGCGASAQSMTVHVAKGSQTIAFAALPNHVVGDAAFAVEATGGASGQPVTFGAAGQCSISGSQVSMLAAGSCTITASQAGDDNYLAAADVPQSFTIDKAAQTITFGALANKTYGDAAFAVSATGGASGNAVSFAAAGACSVAGTIVTITGAGGCTVTASQVGDANYFAAADVAQPFTIDKAAQTIAFGALANKTYGDAPFTVSASGGASGNAVTFGATGACSVAASTVTITGAGSCTITASQAGNANYLPATDVPQSFSIAKGSSAVSWAAPAAMTYGTPLGAAQLNATASIPGTFVYSPSAGTVLAAGDHVLTATFTPSDASINSSTASVTVHVNQAVSMVTWPTPADIIQGTPLGAAQLNASANVAGSFAYSPAFGTVLPVGSGQALSVVFTPIDTGNYTQATATVLINVLAVQPPPADNILVPIADQQNREGDRVELSLQATGVTRRDKVAFIAANLPPGLDIDKDKGLIKGRIRRGSAGQYQATVTLFANRTSYTRSFVWTVTP